MTARDVILGRRVLASVAGLLVIYVVVAEVTGFDLITLRYPNQSVLSHRTGECAVLWTSLCSAVGWLSVLRRKPPWRMGPSWIVVAVPILFGLVRSLEKAWDYEDYVRQSAPLWVYCLGLLLPFALGLILAAFLYWQCRVWRRLGRAGVCRTCGYDLTGNVSGVCPECGTPRESARAGGSAE
jgi:hypothetical protein